MKPEAKTEPERPAWKILGELLALVPKRKRVEARKLAEELFRRGGAIAREFHGEESGATAIEYGLLAAAVAGVLIVVAYFVGGAVSNSLNNVASHLE